MLAATRRVALWLVAAASPLLFGGCADRSLERQAIAQGLQAHTVTGSGFRHRVFRLTGEGSGGTAIVLIDGDGRAFVDSTTVARNPTPRRSWLLSMAPELSALGPVIYLGRPCYHLQPMDPACSPALWTQQRYGKPVIDSLAAAAAAALGPGQDALFVGFSGGGVLALEVARRLAERNRGVITFAAPLDVAAWAGYHGYTPLDGSVDPANDPEIYQQLCQRHYFGVRDREVPWDLVAGWRWPVDHAVTGAPSDHTCCWEQIAAAAVAEQLAACEAFGHSEARNQRHSARG